MGAGPSFKVGPEDLMGQVVPFLIDAARQGTKKYVVDGKKFAPFGMVPHQVSPVKVSAYRPTNEDVPDKVDLRKYMTHVEDQAQTNSCCANAVAGAYEYINKRHSMQTGDSIADISRLFIYYVGRKKDQVIFHEDTTIKPKDEGMTLGGAISALEVKGACLEKNWPFSERHVNDTPHDSCFDEAVRFKVAESREIPVDLDAMKECLAEGHPIVFGLKLTSQFFKPLPGGGIKTPDPSDPQSSEHGLHAMLIVGYNDRQECFIVRNSWGTSWGDRGYAYVPFDYICNSDFNFLGQYCIVGLTDADFTPDPDDGRDFHFQPYGDAESVAYEEYESEEEEDVPDHFDTEKQFDNRHNAEQIFKMFDRDGSGKIDQSELFTCFLFSGIKMSPFEVPKLLAEHDLDGGGGLDFDEFYTLLQSQQGKLGALCGFA
ncbi:unnamed protein product [Symbiodinium natans]|uniref:EF-hand domain-containing protein n=1 Tax=Symbiodinium natans TaxID=878477 RepID=A0A812TZ71_9DINO|nr:unnamed protein product [Symbiodinium natans]